jgi:hypothetical protein
MRPPLFYLLHLLHFARLSVIFSGNFPWYKIPTQGALMEFNQGLCHTVSGGSVLESLSHMSLDSNL